jgi:transcriptional regulator with XRE-family HTH domain
MEITINRRIKQIRERLSLSQMRFSKVISLSSGYLAGVEVEKRKVNDRIIKLICASFSVSERWLRSGEGEMFSEDPNKACTKLVSLYKELNPQYQNYILKQIDLLLTMQEGNGGAQEQRQD